MLPRQPTGPPSTQRRTRDTTPPRRTRDTTRRMTPRPATRPPTLVARRPRMRPAMLAQKPGWTAARFGHGPLPARSTGPLRGNSVPCPGLRAVNAPLRSATSAAIGSLTPGSDFLAVVAMRLQDPTLTQCLSAPLGPRPCSAVVTRMRLAGAPNRSFGEAAVAGEALEISTQGGRHGDVLDLRSYEGASPRTATPGA